MNIFRGISAGEHIHRLIVEASSLDAISVEGERYLIQQMRNATFSAVKQTHCSIFLSLRPPTHICLTFRFSSYVNESNTFTSSPSHSFTYFVWNDDISVSFRILYCHYHWALSSVLVACVTETEVNVTHGLFILLLFLLFQFICFAI